MDFRVNSFGFCLLVYSIVILISVSYGKECRMCKPGYYASRQCTKSHDTVCKPCSKGTFSTVSNVFPSCSLCSRCDVGEFAVKDCTKHSDTVCKLCSDVKEARLVKGNYITECLHIQNDQASIDTDLAATNTLSQNNDNDVSLYESSSDPEEIHVDVLFGEGSGETVTEEIDTNETIIGYTPTVIEEPIENITLEILPEVTTKAPSIVIVDGGIVLSNDTYTKVDDSNVLLLGSKTTTLSAIILDDGQNNQASQDELQEVNIDIDNQQTRTGASKGEKQPSGGTSIGVVVTVGLVAALVFFILGFVASRYWSSRRERTFNVLEAERFNGKPPVECSGIEYKDNEKPGNNASIYDEIPAGNKLNGSTNDTRDPEKASDPVYTKPIKRDTAQKTSAAPPTAPKRGDPSPRPASEIRFIDEEQDAETDRLLSSGTGSDVTNDSKASSTDSGSSESKTEPASPDEKTPMLTKGNDPKSS
ncbi:hypothetical protein ACF0H5_015701 [Mactra antiquata]